MVKVDTGYRPGFVHYGWPPCKSEGLSYKKVNKVVALVLPYTWVCLAILVWAGKGPLCVQ